MGMNAQNNRFDDSLVFTVGFLYFAISHISRILLLVDIPRQVPYAVFFILLGVFFLKNLKSLSWVDALYYGLVGWLVPGVLKYGQYTNGQEYVLSFFVLFVPAYLFFRLFSLRGEVLERCLVAASWFSVLYLLPYYVLCVRGNPDEKYSMGYAYWISLPICVFVHRYWKTRKIAYLLLALVMYATLVLAGCRGALLLTTLFAGFDFLECWNQRLTNKTVLYIVSVVLVVSVLLSNLNLILSFLGQYSDTSRNLQKLLEGDYFVSTTREPIYEKCELLLANQPEGYGPFASRWLIPDHNYPHSLKYELQLDFGKMAGGTVFLLLWAITVFNMLAYRKTKLALVVNYLAIVGMGSLLVSSSYYYEIYVPAMLAFFLGRFVAPGGGRRQTPLQAQGERTLYPKPRQPGELRGQTASPAPKTATARPSPRPSPGRPCSPPPPSRTAPPRKPPLPGSPSSSRPSGIPPRRFPRPLPPPPPSPAPDNTTAPPAPAAPPRAVSSAKPSAASPGYWPPPSSSWFLPSAYLLPGAPGGGTAWIEDSASP